MTVCPFFLWFQVVNDWLKTRNCLVRNNIGLAARLNVDVSDSTVTFLISHIIVTSPK